jgi:hypothetical protein
VYGLIELVMLPEFFPQQPPCGMFGVVAGLNVLREHPTLLVLDVKCLAVDSEATFRDNAWIALVSGRGDCCQKLRPFERAGVMAFSRLGLSSPLLVRCGLSRIGLSRRCYHLASLPLASMYGEDLHVLGLQNISRCLGWVLDNTTFKKKIEQGRKLNVA